MSSKISRRFFLKGSLGLSAAGLSNLAVPTISFGQAGSGPKFVVVLQLLGGLDPLLAFPYMSSADYAALADLRGNYARVNPGQSTPISDVGNRLGLHPDLNILSSYLNRMKIILHTGNAFHLSPNRSHEVATLRMVLGGAPSEVGRKGWMARLYEQDRAVNLIGFGGAKESFLCDKCPTPPLVTSSYEVLDLSQNKLNNFSGGAENTAAIEKTLRELSQLPGATEIDNKWRAHQRSMFEGVDAAKRTTSYITPQSKKSSGGTIVDNYTKLPAFGSSSSNNLSYWNRLHLDLTGKFRNIAQTIFEHKATGSNERVIMVLAQGGHDIHDNWQLNGNNLMKSLGFALKTFLDDLSELGMLNSTAILITSEFGRTIAGNGTGTDHGIGYPSIIIGGRVAGGVIGTPLTVGQLKSLSLGDDAWPREIAQERLIVEIIEKHLGIDPLIAFPRELLEKIPNHGNLNIFV